MIPIKFFNSKGYIKFCANFRIQRDTNLGFISSEAPKVQLKDIQSVYCEFRLPAPKPYHPYAKIVLLQSGKKMVKTCLCCYELEST